MALDYHYSGVAIMLVVIIYLIMLAWLVVKYILRSLSVYTVAKRRGIQNPGLAWVPMIWVWTLGGICDQYDATRGIQRKWRVSLLILTTIGFAAFFIGYILMIVQLAKLAISQQSYVYSFRYVYEYAIPEEFIGALAGEVVVMILGAIAAAASTVCQWICLFKFYESCRPKDALKYLLVSVLVPLGQPICMMCSRKYDLGMPQQPFYPSYPQQPPVNNYQAPPPYNPYQ